MEKSNIETSGLQPLRAVKEGLQPKIIPNLGNPPKSSGNVKPKTNN